MNNGFGVWPRRVPILFSCLVLSTFTTFFSASPALAQDASVHEGVRFYPSSLNSEFSNATRVMLGRVNLPLQSGQMLNINSNDLNDNLQTLDIVARYQEQIHQLEEQQGMFAESLYEPLLSMGLHYQQIGEHQQALEIFDRASQIIKVQTGLYSYDQINLTHQQVQSLQALGDKQQTHTMLERLVFLNQKYYGASHNETAYALQELGNWQLNNFVTGLSLHPDTRLVPTTGGNDLHSRYETYSPLLEDLYTAQSTFINAIGMIVENRDFSDSRLYKLEDDLITTYYLNANREQVLNNPNAVWSSNTRDFGSIKHFKTSDKLPADFTNGESAYKRKLQYLQHNEGATLGDLSNTMLGLADWYQLFEQYDKAANLHIQLTEMLQRAELSETQITELLISEVPVLLPTFVVTPLSPRKFVPESTQGHVDLAIHINRWGKVSDVETLGMTEGTPQKVIDELVSMVRDARFRVDSVEGNNNGIRYYYQYL